jgi:hypothetical protein
MAASDPTPTAGDARPRLTPIPGWAALLAALALTALIGGGLSRLSSAPSRPARPAAPPSPTEPAAPEPTPEAEPFGWDSVRRPLPATPVS